MPPPQPDDPQVLRPISHSPWNQGGILSPASAPLSRFKQTQSLWVLLPKCLELISLPSTPRAAPSRPPKTLSGLLCAGTMVQTGKLCLFHTLYRHTSVYCTSHILFFYKLKVRVYTL